MKNKFCCNIISIAAIIFSGTAASAGQTGYMAGTGISAIEPWETLISLHLGGYGAPREGRFTLQWKSLGEIPGSVCMAGLDDRLYILSGNDLMWCNPGAMPKSWNHSGKPEGMEAIAGSGGKLYSLGTTGEIYESPGKGRIRWKKLGDADQSAKFIAADRGVIYITDGSGTLWHSSLSSRPLVWQKSRMAGDIISFSSGNGKLYCLTSAGEIYRKDTESSDHRWLKMAYRNNATIRQDIRLIAFMQDRIYGVDKDNMLYIGEHRSEGNLSARALAIEQGDRTAVIVNVDVCGLAADFTGELKKEIWKRYKLTPEEVFINMSHTHFAPVTQNWLTWQEANQRPDSIYLNTIIRNGILNAVGEALGSMSPAELYFGRGSTAIGYNRSLKDHPELYDSDVDVLKIVYTGGKKESYLFLAACHPVFNTAGTLHFTVSANYPGVARRLVEERTGSANSLFLQGTAGDINPVDNGEYITGEKLANSVLDVLNKPMNKIEGPISCYLDTIDIAIKPWSRSEILAFRKENEGRTGDVYAEKNVKWADLMIDYYDKGTMPHSLPVYVNTLNIGTWKLVGFSRETTTGYSFGVKKFWTGRMVSVAGYTNDVSSYLPTHMHLEAKNYEGYDSFFWYGAANVFPMDVDEIILNRVITLAH